MIEIRVVPVEMGDVPLVISPCADQVQVWVRGELILRVRLTEVDDLCRALRSAAYLANTEGRDVQPTSG